MRVYSAPWSSICVSYQKFTVLTLHYRSNVLSNSRVHRDSSFTLIRAPPRDNPGIGDVRQSSNFSEILGRRTRNMCPSEYLRVAGVANIFKSSSDRVTRRSALLVRWRHSQSSNTRHRYRFSSRLKRLSRFLLSFYTRLLIYSLNCCVWYNPFLADLWMCEHN